VGVSSGCPNFLGIPPIISRTGKATDFKFGEYIFKANPNKAHKNVGNSSRGRNDVVREPGKFSGHPRIGRIARSLR